jgi:hypothetical protein
MSQLSIEAIPTILLEDQTEDGPEYEGKEGDREINRSILQDREENRIEDFKYSEVGYGGEDELRNAEEEEYKGEEKKGRK